MIADYPRGERTAMRNRTFIIRDIKGTDEDSIIYIKDMSSATEVEVYADELTIIKHKMRDMPILTAPSPRYHILPDNSMVDVYAMTYDCKVDLYNKKFIAICDADYKKSTLPTINELIAMGVMSGKEGTCIEKEYEVFLPNVDRFGEELSLKDLKSIQKEFKENGFNVTLNALKHNYSCWLGDLKSGYRDEKNNYHLFTPCGCNPLSFRATSLHKLCDWQETYFC